MLITDVDAVWLHCPIPYEKQHVSDFGRLASFDTCLVTIKTDTGLTGYGEAKAAVGSVGGAGTYASLVSCIKHELRPILLGQNPAHITRLWEMMYNGTRDHYALARGRTFPILGRRGLTISSMSGVDTALWDVLGKHLGVPIVTLLGGACRDRMPAYASGGWAGVDAIGDQLKGYVDQGFDAVKMRVGVMDGDVATSVARVRAARNALGPPLKSWSMPTGPTVCRKQNNFADSLKTPMYTGLRNRSVRMTAKGWQKFAVRRAFPLLLAKANSPVLIFEDLIDVRALDVLQPDMAICGGITEGMRIASLAATHQLALAPHLWGSAFMFMAGLHLAFASPAAVILEYSLGANPMLHELVEEPVRAVDGTLAAPTLPGLGVTPNRDFIRTYTQSID